MQSPHFKKIIQKINNKIYPINKKKTFNKRKKK